MDKYEIKFTGKSNDKYECGVILATAKNLKSAWKKLHELNKNFSNYDLVLLKNKIFHSYPADINHKYINS